jgi:hypothetical protein
MWGREGGGEMFGGYTHKTSGFKTSGFKTSETSGLQNVRFTKCQVYKTSDLQNVRLQNVRFQNVLACKYFKTSVFKEIHWPHLHVVDFHKVCYWTGLTRLTSIKFYTSVAAMLRRGDRGKVIMTEFSSIFKHSYYLRIFFNSRYYCLFSQVISKIDTLFTSIRNANLAISILFV